VDRVITFDPDSLDGPLDARLVQEIIERDAEIERLTREVNLLSGGIIEDEYHATPHQGGQAMTP